MDMSSANGLVGTGFAYWCFKGEVIFVFGTRTQFYQTESIAIKIPLLTRLA